LFIDTQNGECHAYGTAKREGEKEREMQINIQTNTVERNYTEWHFWSH